MPEYNFDKIIDRNGTDSLKTDALKERFGRDDLIPLWVADMDFQSPSAINEAIIERAKHGIFGYTYATNDYYESIINWVDQQHEWKIKQEWISYIPGIVKGIAFVIDCFTSSDSEIIIQPPVYHPFHIIPNLHNRKVVDNKLILECGQYKMDLEDLKNKISKFSQLLILCNPHNPGGRVWSRQELIDIADICHEKNILVISDEIHADLAFASNKHIPFASVSEKAAQNSITFMAPSKTFNIAGLVSSYSVIPNDHIREKYHAYLEKSELRDGNIFAYVATTAAYTHGLDWLIEVKNYIKQNISFVDDFIKHHIPQIKVVIPEASYLIWLDCRDLNLVQDDLVSLFVNDAKLALNNGAIFGAGGEGFMRLNAGCPQSVLNKALNNLKNAINNKQ